jgi:hypothetical protein
MGDGQLAGWPPEPVHVAIRIGRNPSSIPKGFARKGMGPGGPKRLGQGIPRRVVLVEGVGAKTSQRDSGPG